LFVATTNSQILTSFKGSEGVDTARSYAKKNAITSPHLVFMGTSSMVITIGSIPVPVKFEMNTGKSAAWVYVFRSGDDTTKKMAIFVLKSYLGTIVQSSPVDQILQSGAIIHPNKNLDSVKWIDSDVMAGHFRNNTEFMDFYNSRSDSAQSFVGLYVNYNVPGLAIDEPYWGIVVSDSQKVKYCNAEAVTGDIICSPITSVETTLNINAKHLNVSPNPLTGDVLSIELPYESTISTPKLVIYNSNGIEIASYRLQSGLVQYQLPVGGLINGTYYINLTYDNSNYFAKFVINR
jgi:hypothetical protein